MHHTARKTGTKTTTENEEKLLRALHMLFDLLEDYAPRWYTEEHHEYACDALASVQRSRSSSSLREAPTKEKAA
jgi:hypothetical protein